MIAASRGLILRDLSSGVSNSMAFCIGFQFGGIGFSSEMVSDFFFRVFDRFSICIFVFFGFISACVL